MKKKDLLALINELSRRVALLEARPQNPIIYGPNPPIFGQKCLVCGEYHGSGLPCPKTLSWAASGRPGDPKTLSRTAAGRDSAGEIR